MRVLREGLPLCFIYQSCGCLGWVHRSGGVTYSVLYFSVLTDWILHDSALGLLPLGFAWGEPSYLLLLGTATSCAAHYVVVESCSLCDHVREASRIRQHLTRRASSDKIIGDKALGLPCLPLVVECLARDA